LNSNKIIKNLSWNSVTKIDEGLEKTFLWYLNNEKYFNSIKKNQILKRLGKI
jgi:dTDP-D-glucose 4,6-dehydratase